MFSARASAFCLSLLSVSIALHAQDPGIPMKASPAITAGTNGERIRFGTADTVCQIRVRILAPSGASLFDSEWKDGNVFDWPAEPQWLDGGVYRCAVMIRDLDGQVIEKHAAFAIRGGELSIEQDNEAEGLTIIASDENAPKLTMLAHDGTRGAVVSTSGDLSFRFGNFLAGRDNERMRLTAAGSLGIGTDKPLATLDVRGLMRTSEGVMFPDGTILTSAVGLPGEKQTIERSRQIPGGQVVSEGNLGGTRTTAGRILAPRSDAAGYQFMIDSTGITSSGNLNLPTTGSAAAGVIMIGGNRFLHRFPVIYNTFLGTIAGNFSMTGVNNTGVGFSTLTNNSSGEGNTAIGVRSLVLNSIGNDNTATGAGALVDNTGGSYNTASGFNALPFNSQGSYNTGVGYNAIYYNTTGSFNTAIGQSALYNATGDYNVGLGPGAGYNLTTGSNNIDIGNVGVAAESGTIRIGGFAQANTFISGIRGVTTGSADALGVVIDSNGQLGTISSSRRYKYDIEDMGDATSNVLRLRPVTFRYLAHGDHAPLQYGLIAEEVAKIYPEMVTRDRNGEPDAIMYQYLAPMLLNEVQKQQKVIQSLEDRLQKLEARLAKD